MELEITFENVGTSVIPIDYQYYLSSWLYKVLSKGDEGYAKFLHDTGYKTNTNNKVFKLFSFSNLYLTDFKIENNAFVIKGNKIIFNTRFCVENALESFIKGLFTGESLQIKNGFNSMAQFPVVRVESKNIPSVSTTTKIKLLSPMVVAHKQKNGNDLYLSPKDGDFEQYFFTNLLDKYIAAGNNLKPEWATTIQKVTLLKPEKMRSKLIKVGGEGSQTKVKGYLCELKITAPTELIEIGLLAGFGKENAMGFGYGEVVM